MWQVRLRAAISVYTGFKSVFFALLLVTEMTELWSLGLHFLHKILRAPMSILSAACSMLAVWRQRKSCRRFVDASATRRGCQTEQTEQVRQRLMSTYTTEGQNENRLFGMAAMHAGFT